ncbi:ATP synthase F0 subunit B [Geopsychrobacter electrodiphilus]|uniref:F0F1 ATP synthase subunit B family protein n=1 Tax=Geopsychrobacter electrodiphilus TaxID=225196 RepID=UPI0003A61BDB|nr:ATP synthase F0 subunit B [Geopsychrobacter electrodiphilus]
MRATRTVLLTLALMVLLTGLVYASSSEHAVDSGVLLKDFLYRVFNFAIVVGILVYFLAKPLKKGLSGRREEIEKALAEAEQIKLNAETKFAEYDQKLTLANAEIAQISAGIKLEGEREKEKIIASAREMAIKIEQDAEKSAAREVAKARTQLQAEAVHLAVELAEDLLKKNFTGEDDTRLIDEYMQKVGELH